MENIGSIAKIGYAFVEDLSYFAAWKGVVSYAFVEGKAFTPIPASLKKCEISCEPEATAHGTLYKPQAKLYVPFSAVQAADENWWRFPYCGVILKYRMNSGEEKILGTLDNPLSGSCSEIDPPNPSDWKGWLISLSGQQLHKQLLVE
jgi:hypothetical protein